MPMINERCRALGVPLVIYNRSSKALPMTVFSPLNQPMASHMGSGLARSWVSRVI